METLPYGVAEFIKLQRFHKKKISTVRLDVVFIQKVSVSGDDDDREMRSLFLDLHEKGYPGLNFQPDIGDKKVNVFRLHLLHCILSTQRRNHETTLFPEKILKRSENTFIVINDEHCGLTEHYLIPDLSGREVPTTVPHYHGR